MIDEWQREQARRIITASMQPLIARLQTLLEVRRQESTTAESRDDRMRAQGAIEIIEALLKELRLVDDDQTWDDAARRMSGVTRPT